MLLETLVRLSGLLAMGIEAAFVPTDGGGGDYLVRVEPDLIRNGPTDSPLTSDLPEDARDVRRVKIFVSDTWPTSVERLLNDAAKRQRVEKTSARTGGIASGGAASTSISPKSSP